MTVQRVKSAAADDMYARGMVEQEPKPLISADEVKEILQKADSDYGKDFTPEDWEQIALRIEMLTRLITKMYSRHQSEESQKE